mmetsp:Transcript_11652/g.17269  ORF Transcript_11652/g.17269 Transcript_11652/m.17269 type:complete len:248 (-) Transcript_11652:1417-2160(-)
MYKRRAKRACLHCRESHVACGDVRPCNRCKERNISCIEANKKANEGTKRSETPIHNIVLCVTGSVAAIKIPELLDKLKPHFNVKCVFTKAAVHFLNIQTLRKRFPQMTFYENQDEWASWTKMGDSVAHIELRDWADLLMYCPLSANTLAKLTYGLCNNFATAIFRAFDFDDPKKHIMLAPAMNTKMWESTLTETQLHTLLSRGERVQILYPVEKKLACGDVGIGALAPVDDIVQSVMTLAGKDTTLL